MRSLKFLFRKLLQWVAGVFYEGPEPPNRLIDAVKAFAYMHPVATREDWAQWALEFGESCYRQGFQRGYEQRVEDMTLLAGTVVIPKQDGRVFEWEHATPHQLESEAKIAESVPLRSTTGKVMVVTLDQALEADPKLRAKENDYWRHDGILGPKR